VTNPNRAGSRRFPDRRDEPDHRLDLLAAALEHAARGWRVFPLRPGTKRPALHRAGRCPGTGTCSGGHAGWEQRATSDPDRIRAAWSRAPFNIGVACGPSGLVAVDLDTPKSPEDQPPESWNRRGVRDGHDVFALVCERAGQPVPWDTYRVRTARHGTHLVFTAPAGIELRNTEGDHGAGLGWKVDTRAHGGYVVAAGSITPQGTYQVDHAGPARPLPAFLTTLLTPPPPAPCSVGAPSTVPTGATRLEGYLAAAVAGEAEHVATAVAGTHTRTVFNAALTLGRLTPHHLDPGLVEHALLAAAGPIITGPCDCTARELTRTIRNGLRYGADRPRHLTPPQPSRLGRAARQGRRERGVA
jgi:hypothetical protein